MCVQETYFNGKAEPDADVVQRVATALTQLDSNAAEGEAAGETRTANAVISLG